MKITLGRIKKEVAKVIGSDKDDEDLRAGVSMMAALQVGANADKIAAFTGYPRRQVREWGRRLTENGIWTHGKTNAAWFDKDGAISFCCDINVAKGLMNRVPTSTRTEAK